MGLLGGTHCVAMCSAPCGAVVGAGAPPVGTQPVEQPLRWMQRRTASTTLLRAIAFHAGRVAGYAAMGALAAWAMDSLAWLSQQSMALRPVWTFMHVAVLGWGLMMIAQSRQPAWIEQAGRSVWSFVRPLVGTPGGVATTGMLWALMPCGLLYSALLVAALSGGALQGALAMALFAVGSGAWLAAGPLAWQWGRKHIQALRGEWGVRISGVLLCGVAVWALWMDLVYKPSLWCR
jgi:uncharacterized protein